MALLMRKIGVLIMFLLLMGMEARLARADNLQLPEQEIKAGLLYNFLKYIDWPPASANAPTINICIYGEDPFEGYLQPLAGRTVNQHEIQIHTLRDIHDIDACQLLFINADEQNHWPALLKILDRKNILTVSDSKDFVAQGGMIAFGRKDDKISVFLNPDALKAAQLHVQDRLLKLVTIAHGSSNGGS